MLRKCLPNPTATQIFPQEPNDDPAEPDDEEVHVDDGNEADDDSDTVVNDGSLVNESADNAEQQQEAVDDGEVEKESGLEESSPSPALEIEGVVTGEPDEGGVQSEGGNFHEEDDSEVYTFVIIIAI